MQLHRSLSICLGALISLLFLLTFEVYLSSQSTAAAAATLFILLSSVTIIALHKFSYLNPITAYSAIWSSMIFLSMSDLSKYARPIHDSTMFLICGNVAAFVFGGFAVASKRKQVICSFVNSDSIWGRFKLLIWVNVSLAVLNIVYCGFAPLISGFSGNSRYMEFGIPGVYGLYNAFSNALAVASLYLYLRTSQRRYLIGIVVPLCCFVLFLTRQNIVSLAFECLIAFSFVRKPVRTRTLAIFGFVILLLFSIAGEFRSGNIMQLAGIRQEYSWIPSTVVWPYSYSYFNVLNLDRVVTRGIPPTYSGEMFLPLFPSFLRPEPSHTTFGGAGLEVIYFTVSSYLTSAFEDIGFWGTLAFAAMMGTVTMLSYNRVLRLPSLSRVGQYSTLLFCASFSFFTNFWTYLPIVSQVAFFPIISHWLRLSKQEHAMLGHSQPRSGIPTDSA